MSKHRKLFVPRLTEVVILLDEATLTSGSWQTTLPLNNLTVDINIHLRVNRRRALKPNKSKPRGA